MRRLFALLSGTVALLGALAALTLLTLPFAVAVEGAASSRECPPALVAVFDEVCGEVARGRVAVGVALLVVTVLGVLGFRRALRGAEAEQAGDSPLDRLRRRQ